MKSYSANAIRNVVILGHSGCGKTTIAESALFISGAIKRRGRVEEGNTVSDYDPEEIKRKVSINASLIPVEFADEKINFIDTPGYFDFEGEVRQALSVADLALIVVNGKSGIEVGTEKAWELAEEMKVPKMVFVNGMDDENASFDNMIESLKQQFGKSIAPIQAPWREDGKFVGFVNTIRRKARKFENGEIITCDMPASMEDEAAVIRSMLEEAVAETSDELMEKFFAEESFTEDEMFNGIRTGIVDGTVTPVIMGAATMNIGIRIMIENVIKFLPPTSLVKPTIEAVNPKTEEPVEINCDESEPFSAFVFKTIADPYVGRLSIFKVTSGVLKKDAMVKNVNKNIAEKIGHIYVLRGKEQIEVDELKAGDIGAVAKLQNTSTNDTLADASRPVQLPAIEYPQSLLKMAVKPKAKGDEDKLAGAVAKIMEEDKTILFTVDKETKQSVVSGVGDTHIDVFVNKLKTKYKIDVDLSEPIIPYREKIRGKVSIRSKYKKQSGGHGQYGDVAIDFEPSGDLTVPYVFEEKIFGGSVPKQYFPAVEKGLQESVKAGPLAGYPVVGIKATLIDGSYHPVDSSEMAFKTATVMAFKDCFNDPASKPCIMEPIASVTVIVPDDYTGDVMGDMNKRRGRILGMEKDEKGKQNIIVEVPVAEMANYSTDLRSMTQGRGKYTLEFARYEEAPKDVQDKVIAARKAEQAEK
ncbi:MAG: elongation factor G [Firmicutes bacterium]|nr:elongation factor G [Bacillota bacterium]